MVQGTASSVGKSLVVAALCRLFRQEGLRVAPFKAQNMALNSAATPDGREIGRSTAVQAAAAGVAPTVDMNPVLLKPEGDSRSQVVLLGKPAGRLSALDYLDRKRALWAVVAGALDRLRRQFDLIVIEGAGSPAEVNLRAGDVVNMRVAGHADAPVLLVGDIDRGGVFAALVGTLELLEPDERERVRGLIVNRFRGDLELLRPGLRFLEERTGKPVLGVLPYLRDLRLPEEDAVALERGPVARKDAPLDVAVVQFPRIANFDDFDLLAAEPAVALRYVTRPAELGRPDLVILPGTKTTVADLAFLRSSGLAADVVELARRGTPVLGICGGYQMLGREIRDPERVESDEERVAGLGLLPVETEFQVEKRTVPVRATATSNPGWIRGLSSAVEAYEIHLGRTSGATSTAFEVDDGSTVRPDGDVSPDGQVVGTYLHGLFENVAARDALIRWLGRRKGLELSASPDLDRSREFDRLAGWLRENLDVARLRGMIGL
jgi:adenosylcobyric acid synthase